MLNYTAILPLFSLTSNNLVVWSYLSTHMGSSYNKRYMQVNVIMVKLVMKLEFALCTIRISPLFARRAER